MTIYRSSYDDIHVPDLSITDFVLRGVMERGDEAVLTCGLTGRNYTGTALARAIRSLAGGLIQRGLGTGHVVALMAPNQPDFAVVFHGVAYSGGTITTVNPNHKAVEVHQQLIDSGAEILITVPEFLDTAREAIHGTRVTKIAVIGEAASLRPGIPYTEYVSITDESNLIEMSVPVEWSDIDARLWAEPDLATGQVDNLIGPFLAASPNLDAMVETWGTPGVFLGASPSIYWTLDELLDLFDQSESCTLVGRFDYDDGLYTGLFDNYTNCGAEGSDLMIAFVRPADLSWTAMLQITVVTEADREAASTVVETFMIQPLGG